MSLRSLSLAQCGMLLDSAMDSIIACPQLTELDLSSCGKISDEGLMRLALVCLCHVHRCQALTRVIPG